MLDTTADNLRREAEDAITLRESHTDLTFELKMRYAGPNYRADWSLPDMHENVGFEWTTNMVPNLVFTNPKVNVSHDGAPDTDPQVSAMRDGVNTWIEAVNLLDPLEEIATDLQFDFGVGIITMERCADIPGQAVFGDELARMMHPGEMPDIPSMRPMAYRIPPTRFFMDHHATHWRNARFLGHVWIEDKDDLLAAKNADGSPKYDPKAVEACTTDDGLDELRQKAGTDQSINHRSRNQVVGYEIFVPETGLIYTLSRSAISVNDGGLDGKGIFLRPPRKYVGPATGPYVVFGAYIVPDQLYPLSPLMASAMIEEEINAHAGQASEDAGAAKSIIVANGTKVAKVIQDAENGQVVVVQGFDGKAQTIRLGGSNPENLNYIELLRQRKDRLIGLTQAVSGNVTGATAEEVHTAQANRNLRVRYQQSRFRRGVTQLLTIACSQMWHSPDCRFFVKVTDPKTGAESSGIFQGGQTAGNGLLFDGLRVTIEPYSMEAVDEAVLQHNTQNFGAMVQNCLPLIIQYPFADWRRWLRDQGEVLNIRDGDKYLDWDMVRQAQMLVSPALFGIAPPGMGPGDPNAPAPPGAAGPQPGAPAPAPAPAPMPQGPPQRPPPRPGPRPPPHAPTRGPAPTTNARASSSARRGGQIPAHR